MPHTTPSRPSNTTDYRDLRDRGTLVFNSAYSTARRTSDGKYTADARILQKKVEDERRRRAGQL